MFDLCLLILIVCAVIGCLFVLGLIFCPEEIIADFKKDEKCGRYTVERDLWDARRR